MTKVMFDINNHLPIEMKGLTILAQKDSLVLLEAVHTKVFKYTYFFSNMKAVVPGPVTTGI